MRIFNKFIESRIEPSNKNDIWFDGSVFKIYKEGEWQAFTLPVNTVDRVLEALDGIDLFKIVPSLPEVGEANTIYLVYSFGNTNDSFIEYIYTENGWEKIGNIDPTFFDDYVNTTQFSELEEEVQGLKANKTSGIEEFDILLDPYEWHGDYEVDCSLVIPTFYRNNDFALIFKESFINSNDIDDSLEYSNSNTLLIKEGNTIIKKFEEELFYITIKSVSVEDTDNGEQLSVLINIKTDGMMMLSDVISSISSGKIIKLNDIYIPDTIARKSDLEGLGGGVGSTVSGKYKSGITNKSLTMDQTYGDFKKGETKVGDLEDKTYDELFDGILFPTVYPTITNPTASIARRGYSATQEVGATGPTANNFTTSYDAGAITLSGIKQNNRGGEQNVANSFIYVNGDNTNKTLPSIVALGNTTFKYRAAYAEGPQPKDNKGNNFDSPLAAGSVDSGAITLTGAYYAFVGFTDSDPRDPSFNFRSFIGNGYTRLGKGSVNAGTCNKVWMVVCIPSDWNFTCNTGAGTSMRNNFTEEGNATIILPDNTTKDYKYYALTYPNGDFKDLVIK